MDEVDKEKERDIKEIDNGSMRESNEVSEDNFNPWMIVQRPKRKGQIKAKNEEIGDKLKNKSK